MADPHMPHDDTPDEVDDGLAFAYGAGTPPDSAPSVLHRVREITGSSPEISLRDSDPSGQTPMLKPLARDDERAAGRYAVQGLIGQGGVGNVHRGHDQDLGRDVALKFLHEKYRNDPGILHRFVEEAQIGGQLQHPGIVPVYELGMAGDDRPFFAMKMIKGETLAKQLANRSSPADERRRFLSIFEDVCQTMAYAHARGVVHRDLKPANIMIGSFGEVQVVDWGMGKVLHQGGVADEKLAAERHAQLSVIETVRSAGHGTQSVMGSVMGTPAYMPPEQARGDVEAMDERSDVFALGALLCEILTGQPPYTGEPDELIAKAAMAQLDEAKARLAACAAEQDLVDIALQCLLPAPAARPKSARAVATAIHDHLAAIEARVHDARVEAAEAKVRTQALARQRSLGLALAAAVAVGLLGSLWLWSDAEEQRGLAEVAAREEKLAADTAKAQRDKANAVVDFMDEILDGASPSITLGRDGTILHEMMDKARARIEDGELSAIPEAELRLRMRVGSTYHSLAADDQAEQVLEPALTLARELANGEDNEELAAVLTHLAEVRIKQGDLTSAEALCQESLDMLRRLHPDGSESLRYVISAMSSIQQARGDLAASESLLREALAMQRQLFPEDEEHEAIRLGDLSTILSQRGDLQQAVELARQSLTVARRAYAGDHPVLSSALGRLAGALRASGDFSAATPLAEDGLAMNRRLYPEHHRRIWEQLNLLAILAMDRGDTEEAAKLFREVLELQDLHFDGDHIDRAMAMSSLAIVEQNLGELDESMTLLTNALRMLRRLFPDQDHPFTAAILSNLATTLMARGDSTESIPLLRESIAMSRRINAGDHQDLATSLNNLGRALSDTGEHNQAVEAFRESVAMMRRLFPNGNLTLATSLDNLASELAEVGEAAVAVPLSRESAAMWRRLRPGAMDRHIIQRLSLASICEAAGELDDAIEARSEALAKIRQLRSDDLPILAEELGKQASALQKRGDLRDAETHAREALAMTRRLFPGDSKQLMTALSTLMSVLKARGEQDELAQLADELGGLAKRLGETGNDR